MFSQFENISGSIEIEYLTIEHRDKKGGITNPVDPRFQFELIDSRNDNRIICSVIALTYIDKIFVKLK